MPANSSQTDKLATLGSKPDVEALAAEWKRASNESGVSSSLTWLDDIRYARWAGQTDDGKKHSNARPVDSPAWPFEGASDVRLRLADSVCNELSALLLAAYSRCDLRAQGTEMSDLPLAAAATTLLSYVKDNRLQADLLREAELGAQFACSYGWTAFFVGWDQRISKRTKQISFEEIAAMAMQGAQAQQSQVLAELPMLIQSPEGEDQAAAIIASLIELPMAQAKKFVRGLREEGVGELEEEYVSRNLPMVLALKPYEDICVPPETVDLQSARVVFRRCWHTELELREKVATAGWDEAWVESVCANASTGATFGSMYSSTAVGTRTLDRQNLIEVVYAYVKTMEGEAPVISYTVFCPRDPANAHDAPQYAIHERLDYSHGEYPFVEFRFERTKRALVDSRGVPELVLTDQDELKAQHDSLRDRTAFETLPPIRVIKRVGQPMKVAPGLPLPCTRPDDYSFLEPPARAPQTAFELINRIESRVANYFGLNHQLVPPVKAQMLQQARVNGWLSTWKAVFSQVFNLCLQFMSEEEIVRITRVPLPQNPTDLVGGFDLRVNFDVRELDADNVKAKLEALSKFAVPLDSTGQLNRGALTKLIIQAIAPEAASELILDQQDASQQMYRQIQADVGMMMLGNEPLYTENDPAAKAKLAMLQDAVGKNPKAQAALQGDQLFAALMEKYSKNLQMSAMQQDNAVIGRLGVTPLADEMAQQGGMLPAGPEPMEGPGGPEPVEPPMEGQE